MPMLYQQHFGKGTIVSIVAFLGAKMTQNGTISLDAQKKREPPFSRTVPVNVFEFL